MRPERFELPTCCSGGNRSIQLSYGRARMFTVYMGGGRPFNVTFAGFECGWRISGGAVSARQGHALIYGVIVNDEPCRAFGARFVEMISGRG